VCPNADTTEPKVLHIRHKLRGGADQGAARRVRPQARVVTADAAQATLISNRAIFGERPVSQLAVGSESFTVTNDGGRWVGQAIGMQVCDQAGYDTIVFRGEGGYEGLSAVMVIDYYKGTQNAVVFPGQMPSMPEPSPAP
jgi:hypothetical protein